MSPKQLICFNRFRDRNNTMSFSLRTLLLSQIGRTHFAAQSRSVARHVAPTLREFRRRDKLLGPKGPEPRSGFVEWNFRSELFAFGKRLHEEFEFPLLQRAFTQSSYVKKEQDRQRELGIDVDATQFTDNTALRERGEHISREYVQAFLQHSFPKVPEEGQRAFCDYLLSEKTLANISSHLGTKDLIFSAEYPPTEETLTQTLLAVIGALEQSSGIDRAFLFVRDFICTELNQKDLLEIWRIDNPEEMLRKVCEERKLGTPEARLIGDCGKNTVLAAYNVGIYCNKEMLAEGFGEDVQTAIEAASLVALQSLFDIRDSMRPLNFQVQVKPRNVQLKEKN